MREASFVFVGNRSFVLDRMQEQGLSTSILAIAGSYLAKKLATENQPFTAVSSKQQLIDNLTSLSFDILVTNGCPYILPVSQIQRDSQLFVNIHPSPLPDLRGADPVPGAILHERDSGASCHVMNDDIDAGPLISRVVIPKSPDMEVRLLYQMSFLAEVQAFDMALDREFVPNPALDQDAGESNDLIYYTMQDKDRTINLDDSSRRIVNQVHAFSNRSQGTTLNFHGGKLLIYDAKIVDHPFMIAKLETYKPNEVVFRVEDMLLIRHQNVFILFDRIVGDVNSIEVGEVLQEEC